MQLIILLIKCTLIDGDTLQHRTLFITAIYWPHHIALPREFYAMKVGFVDNNTINMHYYYL